MAKCSTRFRKMFYHNIEESHLLIHNAKIVNLYFVQKDRKHVFFTNTIKNVVKPRNINGFSYFC